MLDEILTFRRVIKNRGLSADELRELQNLKLRSVIRNAYDNVPYYRSLFESAGISPEQIRTVKDLKLIPITTKDELRDVGIDATTSSKFDLSSCTETSTSGSTGESFPIFYSLKEDRIRRMVQLRTLSQMGFKPWDRLAILGSESLHYPRLHQRLGIYRSINILRSLSEEEQIQQLRRFNPTVIWFYPTTLRNVLHKTDYKLSQIARPRFMIAVGDVLDEVMKKRIKEDLDTRIMNLYGATEVGLIAANCPMKNGLHVNADHVILECVQNQETEDLREKENLGISVVTTLNILSMPFIRYRLGDVFSFMEGICTCGSPFPLINPPLGRARDVIKLPDGKLLSPLPIQSILSKFPGIDQFRLIQDDYDKLLLQIAFSKTLSIGALEEIQKRCLEYIAHPVDLRVERIGFIKEDKRKFDTFVSKLS